MKNDLIVSVTSKILGIVWLLIGLVSIGYLFYHFAIENNSFDSGEMGRSISRIDFYDMIKSALLILASIFVLLRLSYGWYLFMFLCLSDFVENGLFFFFYVEERQISVSSMIAAFIIDGFQFLYFNWKPVREYFGICNDLRKKSYIIFPMIGALLYFMPITYYYGDIATSETVSFIWKGLYVSSAIALVFVTGYFLKQFLYQNKPDPEHNPLPEATNNVKRQIQQQKARMPWFKRL